MSSLGVSICFYNQYLVLHFRTRKIKWWPRTCGWSRWVHQNMCCSMFLFGFAIWILLPLTALFLAGVAWLQATLGPPRIRKCHIHPNPLGAHLEARYCPLQQVSASTVARGQTSPCQFSLSMVSRCFLQLFLLILFSVVEFHVDSHNICPRRALNDMTNIHRTGFVLLMILSLDSKFCVGGGYCFLFTRQIPN